MFINPQSPGKYLLHNNTLYIQNVVKLYLLVFYFGFGCLMYLRLKLFYSFQYICQFLLTSLVKLYKINYLSFHLFSPLYEQ